MTETTRAPSAEIDPTQAPDAPERGPRGALRVALVGAGYVATEHLTALRRLRGVAVAAICDPAIQRARALAARFGVASAVGSIEALLGDDPSGPIDAAHVLVPPDQHAAVAERLIEAGLHVLVEKPLALRAEEAAALGAAARERGLVLAVNHNTVRHPTFVRLARDVAAGRLGRLEHVGIVVTAPLRQLRAGQLDHFVFRTEASVLYELAVHPVSQVLALLGPCLEARASAQRCRLPNGASFAHTWMVELRCARGTAQLLLAFDRELPEWTLHAIGTDGAARLDLLRGSALTVRPTRWPAFWDTAIHGAGGGVRLAAQGARAALRYMSAIAGITGAPGPYEQCMAASVASFYEAIRGDGPPVAGAEDGRAVVEACARIARAAGATTEPTPRSSPPPPGPPRTGEVVVTGGAGLIGRHLLAQLVRAGRPVTLLVRRPAALPERLRDPRLRIFAGDALDPAAVSRAARGADALVHLATCAGEGDPEAGMVAGARAAAEACLEHGVRRLVFASSVAALDLGGGRRQAEASPADEPDRRPERRGAYARAKIAAEHALRRLEAERGLRVVILRPAIVLGDGAAPEHSGFGTWAGGRHCIGWSMGRTPLPLLLASDCAAAIGAAIDAPDIDGRAYNLAGDIRLTARELLEEMRRATGRPYRFHPRPPWARYAVELAKWLVKVAVRKPGREPPSYHDLRSRAFGKELRAEAAKRELGWTPVADRETFIDAAVRVHAPRPEEAP